MAMSQQAVAAYLAVIYIGAAVVSVAESFSTAEIAARFKIAKVDLIIVQESVARGGKEIPLYSKIQAMPHNRALAVVVPSATSRANPSIPLSAGDEAWSTFLKRGEGQPRVPPHLATPDEVTNVLFSSGTTGEPKAIPWSHVTPLRAAVNAWGGQDVRPLDVVAWPTSLGWMMGPWLLFATLLNCATVALFLGAPTARAFGVFVEATRVSMLGLVPSIVKAWRSSGCMDSLDWSAIRCFSSSGEASSAEDSHWLMSRAGYKPVMEYCGGTEIGGAFCGGTMLHPCIPSSFATCNLGMDLFLLDESDASCPPRAMAERRCARGEVALRAPALGTSQALLNRDHFKVYFEGMSAAPPGEGRAPASRLRRHGDAFEVMPGLAYFKAHGRTDDTMNLGGIKVSSIEIERVCTQHVAAVEQAAAVSVPASGGGPEELHVFAVLQAPSTPESPLLRACQQALRTHLNPLFKVHSVVVCTSLPRNASNKVMRRVLRDQLVQSVQSRPAKL